MTIFRKRIFAGNSLAVQWLGLRVFSAGGMGSISGMLRGAAKKQKKIFADVIKLRIRDEVIILGYLDRL